MKSTILVLTGKESEHKNVLKISKNHSGGCMVLLLSVNDAINLSYDSGLNSRLLKPGFLKCCCLGSHN